MTFTMRIKDGVVVACHTEHDRVVPVPMSMCDIAEAVARVFDLMQGNQFDIEFVNV